MPNTSATEKQIEAAWRRMDSSVRYVEREKHPDLERAKDLYAGKHWPNYDRRSEQPRIVVNYMRPTVETKVANIAFAYPDFRLKPLNQEGEASQSVGEHLLRYDWRMGGVQREVRRALRDREIYGLGVIYDGWLFETEPVDGEPSMRTEGGRPAQAVEPEDMTPDTNPEMAEVDGTEDLPGLEEPMEAPKERVRTDRPFAKRISPAQFFCDLECDTVLENAAFCGFWEYRPLEEVKADKRYKNTRQLKGSAKGLKSWLEPEMRDRDEGQLPSDVRRVKLFHMFERGTKRHYVFCDEHKKPLMVREWSWEGDWYPFAILRSGDDEDCFWPTPPLIWIEHQQREINESRTQHSEWRRQAVPKYQTRGTLDEHQRQRIASSSAGTIAENLQEPVTVVPHNPLQPEVLQASNLALQDLQFIAGLNDYETAEVPTKRMTAPEVEAVRSSGGSRGASDRQAFEAFCAQVAEHFLALEQQYSVRSRTLPIFDRDDNVTGFVDFTPEQIKGKFLVEVYVGSTSAPNSQDTLQGIAFAMQSLTPLLQTIPVALQMGIDLRPLIPRLLKAALPEIRDIDELLQPPPMPAAPPGIPPGLPPGAPPGMAEPPPDEMGGGMPQDALAQLAQMMGGGMPGPMGG